MTFESKALEQAGNEQLDKLAAEFDRWRSQKKSQAERIPESLIREAQKLSEFIDASQVRKRLKLTPAPPANFVDQSFGGQEPVFFRPPLFQGERDPPACAS